MLASDIRRNLDFRIQEAENYVTYDPELDGVEPLFYDLDQGEQIDTSPFAFHGDPFLEVPTVDDVLDVDSNHANGSGLESKSIGKELELVSQVLRDPQDGIHPMAVDLPKPIHPDESNQNIAVGISLPNTREGMNVVPLFLVHGKSCNPHSTRTAHSVQA
jgi:hypothetical protein